MSFQWIFDNAESISINKRPLVSQTISRDQRVRSISRGGAVWRFTVKMPTGMRWSDVREYIENIDNSNKLTTQTISLGSTGYSWMLGYRGTQTSPQVMTWKYSATEAASDTTKFVLGSMPGSTGAVLFKAGDFIQPNVAGGHVYTITTDVVKGAAATQLVQVHRTILETPSNDPLPIFVANNVSWKLICTDCPTWTIVERDIVGWNGEFQFYESLL
jgi:hypothetical protein